MVIQNKLYELAKFVKFDLFTVDENFVLQLFDKSTNPNDINVSCIWENDNPNLYILLDEAMDWIKKQYS